MDRKFRINLAALPVKMLDSVPDLIDKLLDKVKELAPIRLALLDREFFSVGSLKTLERHDVTYLVPCRNTGNVVSALNEFEKKQRGKISENILENSYEHVTYKMLITKRENVKNPENAGQRWIGFATNDATISTKEYTSRWGIETGYRLIELMKLTTRITDPAARLFCFYYALLLFNEWMILRMRPSKPRARITRLAFKDLIELQILKPKPPP